MRLLWLAGSVLAARCFFEAVMTPYYLTPPLVLLLVLAARREPGGSPVSAVAAAGISLVRLLASRTVGLVAAHRRRHDGGDGAVVPAGDRPRTSGGIDDASTVAVTGRDEPTNWSRLPESARVRFGPGHSSIGTYSGPTVCFLPGSSSRRVSSSSSALDTTFRVSAGSMTASTKPRSAA